MIKQVNGGHGSNKRNLMALEATSDGVWDWNISTGEIITSPSYFTMLGYSTPGKGTHYPELITSYAEFIEMVHLEDRKNIDSSLHDYISNKKDSFEIELRMKTKSGGWKWILKRGRAVEWNEKGEPIRIIGTHIDINESRLAKDKLKQSRERIRAQYMGTPIPTYTWQKVDNKIILTDYNSAANEFSKGKISNFIGLEAHLLYKDNKEIYLNILKIYHDQKTCKFETLYRMFTTEDCKYIKFTCAFIAPDMVLVHMDDITKQKLFEAKIQQSEKNLRNLTEQLFRAEESVRRFIAQELHDSIGQYLSSIKYTAEKITSHINAGDVEQGRFSLDALVSLTQSTIDEVSRISMGLHPSTLDDLGILATISWFCREFSAVYPNIRLEKVIGIAESDVPAALKTPLFRILQESLNNVARHSQADEAKIILSKAGERVEMSIVDNGIGFDAQENISGDHNYFNGFGLISMQERTKYTGGDFFVSSTPQKGTKIFVSWPCK